MRFTRRLGDAARRWARRRQGLDRNPIVLNRRRIYILPTRQGATFGALLFAMLLGSMNYSSSPGFLLTFSLAALAFVAMNHTHRNLEKLEIRIGHADAVFAGNEARFPLYIHNASGVARNGIALDDDERTQAVVDIAPESAATLHFRIRTSRRGWLRPQRIGLHTTYPFGLFRAWVWLHPEASCLVYPAPAEPGLAPPVTALESGSSEAMFRGHEDFTGLRAYQPGDAPRHVAWRASARLDGDLLVKEFGGGAATTRMLRWQDVMFERDDEARLSRLARWIMDAHAADERWGLELPGVSLPVDGGQAHFERCLRELALFGLPR